MTVLIVSATDFEIAPLLHHLESDFEKTQLGFFKKNSLSVRHLVTGIGMTATAWALANLFAEWKPTLAINAGIAGTYGDDLKIGSVVNVVRESFADLGVEQRDGEFTDLFDLGFLDPNQPPYTNKHLYNPGASHFQFLPSANGLTVNKVNGSEASIRALVKAFPDAQVETMEGAAFFYGCLLAKVNFLEIRSISNKVETRNVANWDMPLAIENLNKTMVEMLNLLAE